MSDEISFQRGPARRPAPIVTDPVMQWSTGLQTTTKAIYSGWLMEAKAEHTDLGAAMGMAEFKTVTIKHGNGNVVMHWALPTATIFVIAEGMQTIPETKATSDRYGIAFGWRQQDGRAKSVLRARVFVRELLDVGYTEPLLLTLSGTVTGDFLNGLERQYAALDAIETLRKQQGKPVLNAPFYALSIPFGVGADVVRGQAGASKEISPPQAHIPDPITRAYLLAHYITPAWVPLIESRLDATIAWSISESRKIATDTSAPITED